MSLTPLKNLVRALLTRIDSVALRVCERFPYLSNLYYCFSRDFEKEHHAVIVGRSRYYQSVRGASDLGHRYRLRRNTHRLEKGLISRPLRDVFARDYVGETIASFEYLYSNVKERDDLYLWSESVLRSYFTAVKPDIDKGIDELRGRFAKIAVEPSCDAEPRAPYLRDQAPLRTTVDDLLELAKRRRSVRWYEPRQVPREAIDQAVVVAGYSPSACNRQPFEFRVFDDPALIAQLADVPMGTRGFSHQFPVFIVIVGKLHAYPFARDRHVIYIDASLAAMALEYALEVQGIATCSINWPDVRSREVAMAKLLGLKPDERVVMCISAGYPDTQGLVPYSQKKPLDELRSYNRMANG
ncbi:nitroreductase family protein [Botrimarina hoheduenensis]|uniref:Nitroreductase family protein n=1 Tax=Botrimarina hoheduenensis TaxID=2528000 RepID=A0A5C5WBC1_9BACT|nr:nitroreductase family protein [Botrimarina hoheduenensis]TWT47369.1 Nitroreductase family protein [Botrimarina hoheduenensis]